MAADPPDIPTVRLDGATYRFVFAALFRPHTPAERGRLLASIRRHGVRVRVLTYDSPTWGRRCVVDGASRLELAAEIATDEATHLTVPVQHLGDLTDDAARELALTLNADRRHLTPEEQQAARRDRIRRVVEGRADGDSLRTIAAREGVSEKQVREDLKAAGAEGSAPDRVHGADGKSYPTAAPRIGREASGAEGSAPGRDAGADASAPGRPVSNPEAGSEAVGSAGGAAPAAPERQLAQARTALGRLRTAVAELLAGEWAPHLRRLLARHRADQTAATLDAALSDLAAEAAQGFGAETADGDQSVKVGDSLRASRHSRSE
jgi:hypothetical protein